MMGFKEFFLSEEKGNKNPTPQKKVHVSSRLAVVAPLPVNKPTRPPQVVQPDFKPVKIDGIGIVPSIIDKVQPQTVFKGRRPTG